MTTQDLPLVALEATGLGGSREETFLRLTIQRRAKRNALNDAVIAAFQARLEEAAAISGARFLVIEGEGPEAFCAGADRSVLGLVDEQGAVAFIRSLHLALDRLRGLDLVTIAAIRGHCIGAGLELAAACDFRVAEDGAVFSMPEVLVGIPSVIEAALLPGLIGWGAATDLMLTGRAVEVAEALQIGLIQRRAAAGKLDNEVERLVDQLEQACPRAQAAQKQLFRCWRERTLEEGIEAGIDALGAAYRPVQGEVEAHRRLRK